LKCCNFYLAACPAVRYTSLAGRHGYYGCGGLLPFRLLALVAVACRQRAVPLPSGAELRAMKEKQNERSWLVIKPTMSKKERNQLLIALFFALPFGVLLMK
jgi:hypothetical protein